MSRSRVDTRDLIDDAERLIDDTTHPKRPAPQKAAPRQAPAEGESDVVELELDTLLEDEPEAPELELDSVLEPEQPVAAAKAEPAPAKKKAKKKRPVTSKADVDKLLADVDDLIGG